MALLPKGQIFLSARTLSVMTLQTRVLKLRMKRILRILRTPMITVNKSKNFTLKFRITILIRTRTLPITTMKTLLHQVPKVLKVNLVL